TGLDVRGGGRIPGRLDRPGLPPDRRPAARQARPNRRRDRSLRDTRQACRLADHSRLDALPALGRCGRAPLAAMLVLDRVGKTYPNGVRALDGISLEVAPGEILVVIG